MPESSGAPLCPWPSSWTVERALREFLRENGYTVEQYDAPRTPASVLGIPFSVPNPPRHRWAIMLHDLHHIATGFGTDAAGEVEVSAWELRQGIRPLGLYVGAIVLSGALLGVLVAPRRTWRAWRASSKGRSLFFHSSSYDELLGLTVGELRHLLGLPEAGLERGSRRLHSLAPRPGEAS